MFTEYLLCAGHCARHSGKDSEMDKVTVLKELNTWQGRNTWLPVLDTGSLCDRLGPDLPWLEFPHAPFHHSAGPWRSLGDGLFQAGPHAVLPPPLGEPRRQPCPLLLASVSPPLSDESPPPRNPTPCGVTQAGVIPRKNVSPLTTILLPDFDLSPLRDRQECPINHPGLSLQVLSPPSSAPQWRWCFMEVSGSPSPSSPCALNIGT